MNGKAIELLGKTTHFEHTQNLQPEKGWKFPFLPK
jgi:hypothetical protein